jgi:ABC-type transporter Mla subunit MlaD
MKNILTCILLLGLISCSDSEYYKVQFENVDRLTEGDKVILKGMEVGQVKDLELDNEKKILATIWVGRNIKLTKGSTFTIHADLLGMRHVEIDLADNQELMDTKEIQKGFVQPPDTTGFKKLTEQERDSLVKHDPVYRLADTVMTILRKSKDSTKVER